MRVIGIIVVRFERSIYAIVTSAVVCSLLALALIKWQGPAQEGATQQIPVASTCYVVAALGVILLGWHWLRLAGVITSIADIFEKDSKDQAGEAGGFFASLSTTKVGELQEAVNERLTVSTPALPVTSSKSRICSFKSNFRKNATKTPKRSSTAFAMP